MVLNSIRVGLILVLVVIPGNLLLAQNGEGNGNGDVLSSLEFEINNVSELPEALIRLNQTRSPFTVIVSKESQQLYIYVYDGQLHLLKTLQCTTGENPGNKKQHGDKKTPVGIYFFTKIMESVDIDRMYGKAVAAQFGIRAFDTNYPNPIDVFMNRSGYGIWMHGTDKPERTTLPYSTRGCVVMRNSDIEFITPLIELYDTPIVIMEEIENVGIESLNTGASDVESFVISWLNSWQNKDFETYESCYSPDFRYKSRDLKEWINYKMSVLNEYEWISIELSNVRILGAGNQFYVDFDQSFQTDIYKDIGLKQLYLFRENDRFFIVDEVWKRYDTGSENRDVH